MAIATATCVCRNCGKTFEFSRPKRNLSIADSFSAWAKDNVDLCPDCYRSERRTAINDLETAYRLPELTGSAKQIYWARSIRYRYVREGESIAEQSFCGNLEQRNLFLRQLFVVLDAKTSAAWWIEAGGYDPDFRRISAYISKSKRPEDIALVQKLAEIRKENAQ